MAATLSYPGRIADATGATGERAEAIERVMRAASSVPLDRLPLSTFRSLAREAADLVDLQEDLG